ncbi:Uncharacterized protein TCM_036143 [Theobroma cacao]|uniref:Uncharacterized protein n=1 Tax=Theobroma cacao TaxID=3641 RepID=A0A061FJZ6_THECC|nr:Uncharacterized protein TCM_036143 [Theobroma cacao]
MLNEVHHVLIKDDRRRDYDASIGPIKVQFGKTISGYSPWKGLLRPQAIFVDANPFIVYSFTPFQDTYIAHYAINSSLLFHSHTLSCNGL